MIKAKKINSLSQNIFSTFLFCLLTTTLNVAHAMNKPVAQEARVDAIALEVEKLKTIDEVSDALEQTQQAVISYQTNLRQLGKGIYFDGDQKETEKAIEATEALIQEQERKASLLRTKLSAMKNEIGAFKIERPLF